MVASFQQELEKLCTPKCRLTCSVKKICSHACRLMSSLLWVNEEVLMLRLLCLKP